MIDLAQARAQLQWTRRQLADALQVKVSSVRNFEVGRAIRFPADKVPVLRDLLGGDVPERRGMVEIGGWRVKEKCGTIERSGQVEGYDGLRRNFVITRRGKRTPLAEGWARSDGKTYVWWYSPEREEWHPSFLAFKQSRGPDDGYTIAMSE